MSKKHHSDPPDVTKGDKTPGSDGDPPKPVAGAEPEKVVGVTHDEQGRPIHVGVGSGDGVQNRPEGTAQPVATPGTDAHTADKLDELERQRADDDGMRVPPHGATFIPNPRPPVRPVPPPEEQPPDSRKVPGHAASAPPRIDPETKR